MSPGHCLPPSSNIARHSTGDDKTTIATPVSGFLSLGVLVMSPSWIVKDKSDKGEGLHSLYVKKAIVFDRGGFSFIDVFRVPRKCTYFVNYFTRACTDGKRGDGEEIELDLDCHPDTAFHLLAISPDIQRVMIKQLLQLRYPDFFPLVTVFCQWFLGDYFHINCTVEHHNNHGCLRRPLLVVDPGLENSGIFIH
jgi:hypothetical protein